MSERTLQRRLKEEDTSFQAELNNVQMRTAQQLLLETDMKLTAVAVEVGCASLQHFSSLFRKLVGESPSTWREQHRKGTSAPPPVSEEEKRRRRRRSWPPRASAAEADAAPIERLRAVPSSLAPQAPRLPEANAVGRPLLRRSRARGQDRIRADGPQPAPAALGSAPHRLVERRHPIDDVEVLGDEAQLEVARVARPWRPAPRP